MTEPKGPLLSNSAMSSVAAVLASTPNEGRTEYQKLYDAAVMGAVEKPEGHKQDPVEDPARVKRLYTVTTIASGPAYGGTRTWGVFDKFELACETVEMNDGDIFENSYMFAVVEAIACNCIFGAVALDEGEEPEQYWYVWVGDPQTGRYCPIQRPAMFDGVINFGVG